MIVHYTGQHCWPGPHASEVRMCWSKGRSSCTVMSVPWATYFCAALQVVLMVASSSSGCNALVVGSFTLSSLFSLGVRDFGWCGSGRWITTFPCTFWIWSRRAISSVSLELGEISLKSIDTQLCEIGML